MKIMEKKNFLMVILVLVLVFGVFITGCNSIKANYYSLGDVSEENCALIQVTPVSSTGEYIKTEDGYKPKNESEYRIVDFVEIDGQGDRNQWQAIANGLTKGEAIVRVPPGEHTFTLFFIRDGRENPVSITYNCKAGKGYEFRLIAVSDPIVAAIQIGSFGANNRARTEIIIDQFDLDEKGSFKALSSITVAKKREVHDDFHEGVSFEEYFATF